MRKLFLIGPRHSGKTTAIFRALTKVGGVAHGGFAVKRVCRAARAPGVVTVSSSAGGSAGSSAPGAPDSARVRDAWSYRVVERFDVFDLATRRRHRVIYHDGSRWVLDREGFREVAAPAVHDAVQRHRLVVLDELGVFEYGVNEFIGAVKDALQAPVPVLGVIKLEARRFIDLVSGLHDAALLSFTPESRDAAAQQVNVFVERCRRRME